MAFPSRTMFTVLTLVATIATSLRTISPANAQITQPNILVIITDDQRGGTLGLMPAVRRWLVQGGIRYPNAFATTPLCCPSRASLLTGLLAHNHGITTNRGDEAEKAAAETLMLQGALQGVGYRTGLFGKYLNGWPNSRNPTGWDRWAITPIVTFGGDEWNLDGTIQVVERNSTPFIGGRALDFLEETEGLDDATPWFAHVGFIAPHLPATVPEQYADVPVPPLRPTPAMLERDFSDKPPWLRQQRGSPTTL